MIIRLKEGGQILAPIPQPLQVMTRTFIAIAAVFAIAAGTTLSAGFFLLPSIAAKQAGPTLAFVKMLVPVSSTAGDLVIRMSRLADGQATPTVLFSRSVSYQLRQ